MAATEFIEKAIQDLEAERAKITLALEQLRSTLATMKNGSSAPKGGGSRVFQRKYEQNARDLIARVLRDSRKALHVGQIEAALKTQGYEFLKATIALNLKHLSEGGVARQIKAPKGSGYTYAWILEKERTAVEEAQD